MTVDARKLRKVGNSKEQRALKVQQAEAEDAGATLRNGGFGGLSPSLVLGVMRRDGFACKRCGGQEQLGVHHKGGIVDSGRMSALGHRSVLENLVTLCERCHGDIHDDARSRGVDSSQITPEGDKE